MPDTETTTNTERRCGLSLPDLKKSVAVFVSGMCVGVLAALPVASFIVRFGL